METLEDYFINTDCAIKSLFDMLSEYEKNRFSKVINFIINVQNNKVQLSDIKNYKTEFNSIIFSKHIIAGSILQIAYMAIKIYSKNKTKSLFLQMAEQYINQYNKDDSKRKFCFDKKFCIGKIVEDIPMGLIIYTGRNQYNHMNDVVEKMSLENKNILNDLSELYPIKINDFNLDVKDKTNLLFAYSILDILGWTPHTSKNPYEKYKQDMIEALC